MTARDKPLRQSASSFCGGLRTPEALRLLKSEKWQTFPPDIWPAFVAEMDFPAAPEIIADIETIVSASDLGYPYWDGAGPKDHLASSFAHKMQNDYGLEIRQTLAIPLVDVVQGLYAAILAYTKPGDAIVVPVPCYPPMRTAVLSTGRRILPLPLSVAANRYIFNQAQLEEFCRSATMIILCNPHNPTGKVYSREELENISEIAEENDLVVVSDEVHSDLVFQGYEHIPYWSISHSARRRSVTLMSATKSFNIAGARCAVAYFGEQNLLSRFQSIIPPRLLGEPNVFGIRATLTAWGRGQRWLSDLKLYLEDVRRHVSVFLATELPEIDFVPPQGTYFAWIDFNSYQLNRAASAFLMQEAGVALSPGEAFDPSLTQFARFNFAMSKGDLDRALSAIAQAIKYKQ